MSYSRKYVPFQPWDVGYATQSSKRTNKNRALSQLASGESHARPADHRVMIHKSDSPCSVFMRSVCKNSCRGVGIIFMVWPSSEFKSSLDYWARLSSHLSHPSLSSLPTMLIVLVYCSLRRLRLQKVEGYRRSRESLLKFPKNSREGMVPYRPAASEQRRRVKCAPFRAFCRGGRSN